LKRLKLATMALDPPSGGVPCAEELQADDGAALVKVLAHKTGAYACGEFRILEGGLSGAALLQCELRCRDGVKNTEVVKAVVVKVTTESSSAKGKQLALWREAKFYEAAAAASLDPEVLRIPEVLHAVCCPETGRKLVVLEDLSGTHVQAGLLYGKGSPLNWSCNLDEALARFGSSQSKALVEPTELTERAFVAAAAMHARYWMDAEALREHAHWLRGAGWVTALDEALEGRAEWEAMQRQASDGWASVRASVGTGGVAWDERVVALMDASIASISWERFQGDIQRRPWTLVHGDFHPANAMASVETGELKWLDFELVGIGSGPQDLAQFVISHMDAETRRGCERRLVERYHAALEKGGLNTTGADTGGAAYSYEQCWSEYVSGGTERWV